MLTGTVQGYVFLGIVFLINIAIWGVAQAKLNQITKENAEQLSKQFLTLIVVLLLTNVLNLVMLFNRVDQMEFIVPSLIFAVFSVLKVRPRITRCYAETKRLL